MGIWRRQDAGQDVTGLVHHSDRGVQYRALRYTERLHEVDAVASVGSKGDSYDNAMAEALNSLFTAELVRGPAYRQPGGWPGIDDLEFAIMDWVGWYNNDRLHSELGHVPPTEHEATYWAAQTAHADKQPTVDEQCHDELGEQLSTSPDHASTASHAQPTEVLAMTGSN